MAQQIFFKRNRDIYNSQSLAVDALNKLTFSNGEPVVVQYVDQATSSVRILFAIGIANGYGPDKYRLISTFSNFEELTSSLQALSAIFSLHEDTLANDTTPGHVYDSAESDLEYKNGIATLKKGSIAFDVLEQASQSGIIGISSKDLSVSNGQVSPKLLNWSSVTEELFNSGYRPIQKLTIGDVSLTSRSPLGDDIKITLDNNFSVTQTSPNQATISFVGEITGGEGGGSGTPITGELNTIAGPVKIQGNPGSLVTSFSNDDIAFPVTPSIDKPVSVGDINDTPTSDLVSTVGYVNSKISQALAANDAMHYKGTFNPTTQTLPIAGAGDMYVISATGNINGLGVVHSGDMIICFKDNTSAQYPSNWQIVEVHTGTVSGPSTSVDSNLVAFDGSTGKVIKDSGIKTSDIVKGNRRVGAGSGLELVGNISGELGQGDVVVAHSKVTKEVKGSGNVVTGIETNDYGHVTKITYGQGGTGSGLEDVLYSSSESDGKGWSGQFVSPGYFINGIALENSTLHLFAGKMPGTVRVNALGNAQYLADAIVGKSNTTINEYPVLAEVSEDKLQLSVLINRIDGGEF